jgi:tetratricopeptide (TPR) repeat protein
MVSCKKLVSFGAVVLVVMSWASGLWAQQTGRPGQPVSSELRTLRGQIFQPYGGVFDRVMRFTFSSHDGQVNQVLFTDTSGRFIIPDLDFNNTYIITVEGDGRSYETTTQTVQLSTLNYVAIFLRPKKEERKPAPGVVSAAAAEIPKAARRAYEEGIKRVAENRLDEAMKWMKRAIERHPRYVSAHNELGVIRMKLGQMDAAIESYQQAIKIDDQFYLPFLNLGIAFCKKNQFDEAAAMLTTAVRLNPSSSASRFYLGVALVGCQRYIEAEKELKEAYHAGGSQVAAALLYLGQLYYEQKNYEKAVEAFEQYLKEVPGATNAAEVRTAIERLRSAARAREQ